MDRRNLAANRRPWWESLDEQRMRAVVVYEDDDGEERRVEVPIRFKVCTVCDGKGRHVNPGVDAHGITGDEVRELGPDFMEDYRSGVYDVDCYGCEGKRVEPVIVDRYLTPAQTEAVKIARRLITDSEEMAREMERERAFGC